MQSFLPGTSDLAPALPGVLVMSKKNRAEHWAHHCNVKFSLEMVFLINAFCCQVAHEASLKKQLDLIIL